MIEIAGAYHLTTKLKVGSKVKFQEEKQRYTVRASNVAFAVCTKPFNPKRTVLYTIIDWMHGIRGTQNLIFPLPVETEEDCVELLRQLTDGEVQVTHRNQIPLKIEQYDYK
jgi:hypothetical protein